MYITYNICIYIRTRSVGYRNKLYADTSCKYPVYVFQKTGTRTQPVCRPRSSNELWYQVQSNIVMRSRQQRWQDMQIFVWRLKQCAATARGFITFSFDTPLRARIIFCYVLFIKVFLIFLSSKLSVIYIHFFLNFLIIRKILFTNCNR